jgi:hypothetical protein
LLIDERFKLRAFSDIYTGGVKAPHPDTPPPAASMLSPPPKKIEEKVLVCAGFKGRFALF